MKKYLFSKSVKFIMLTLAACMIIFFIVADYYHSEKDIFTDGEIVFNYSTMERNVTITATAKEEKLIRKWLTTLSSDDQTLHPLMVGTFPDIIIIGENGSVGFSPGIKETYIYPEIGNKWRKGHALQMYIAHSNDAELTQQIIDLCSEARESIN
ncbi:MAG: hypothetical protein IJE55_01790 [Clostridia bacterium]|nr:hypothetical protein [Clostridia bacterium]